MGARQRSRDVLLRHPRAPRATLTSIPPHRPRSVLRRATVDLRRSAMQTSVCLHPSLGLRRFESRLRAITNRRRRGRLHSAARVLRRGDAGSVQSRMRTARPRPTGVHGVVPARAASVSNANAACESIEGVLSTTGLCAKQSSETRHGAVRVGGQRQPATQILTTVRRRRR